MSARFNGTTQYAQLPSTACDAARFTWAFEVYFENASFTTWFLAENESGALRRISGDGGGFRNPTAVNIGGSAGTGNLNTAGVAPGVWRRMVLVVDTAAGTTRDQRAIWYLADQGGSAAFSAAGNSGDSPSDWATFVGSLTTPAGVMRLFANAAGTTFTQLRVRRVMRAEGVAWTATQAAAYNTGVRARAITPSPTWYREWNSTATDSDDVGTVTLVGTPTFSTTGDGAIIVPPNYTLSLAGVSGTIPSLTRTIAAGSSPALAGSSTESAGPYTYSATSNATGIATVSGSLSIANGATTTTGAGFTIVPVAVGNATVEITESVTGRRQWVLVTVTSVGASITPTPATLSLGGAGSAQGNITGLTRSPAAPSAVTYSATTSDAAVATVTGSLSMASSATTTTGGPFVVSANGTGTATITITESGGGPTTTVAVTVAAAQLFAAPSSLSLTTGGANGNITDLTRSVVLQSGRTYTASSTNPAICTVTGSFSMSGAAFNSTGGPAVVTPVAAGSTTITIVESSSGLTASIPVTVTAGAVYARGRVTRLAGQAQPAYPANGTLIRGFIGKGYRGGISTDPAETFDPATVAEVTYLVSNSDSTGYDFAAVLPGGFVLGDVVTIWFSNLQPGQAPSASASYQVTGRATVVV